ncbi:SGNH/GDSL hydrolase family protein [Streptomyces sp. AK02-01A]|uniref:SGNH/GDSL hydrolase family protein n=1 Tax=Streptomyces sp. AK02-01A TaxID=3028648 RepID=UPI0029B711EC|nr:SGNH/GDSL hydrolase family protein [Streptomyces sp. AK02-01A]MDX3855160.1 SGNH/GDSL hydrolase family protein [Streptomyces sp. AK02-01A]
MTTRPAAGTPAPGGRTDSGGAPAPSAGAGPAPEAVTAAPPGPAATPPRTLRYAALGDSLTAGVGDPVDGGWRGWAALLGAGIAGPSSAAGVFRNFAVSGALTRDVEEHQAPAAVEFEPGVASVVVGVNDTLRRAFDIQDLAQRLDRICGVLAAHGTLLLTACLPDPGSMLGLPAPLARPLARRQRAVNAVVHALSTRYDTVHLHMADASWVADRSLWSADRLHPGERGHRMIALRFHELLAARGLVAGPPPALETDQPSPTRTAALLWLATSGTGWVARRCRDLLPELLRLAGDEVRHGARGTSSRLDLHAEHALSRALAALSSGAPLARMGE